MVRADAVRWPRVFQRFALTQVAGLGFAAAPGTEDLHLADVTLPMPCHPYWPRDCDARDRVTKLHLCTGGGNGRDRLQTYQTQRASAPNPASDHMRIAAHSSRASATKIAVISAPMILAIAVPSSVGLNSSGHAMRMPETDRPQVRGSSSWTRLSETREAGDVPGKGETCLFVRAYFPRLTGGEDYPPLRRRRFTARCRGRHLYQTHPLTSAPARSRLNANAVVVARSRLP